MNYRRIHFRCAMSAENKTTDSMEPAVRERMICWRILRFVILQDEERRYGEVRQAIELALTDEEVVVLTTISRWRIERASRVSQAAILLAYRETPSFWAVGQRVGADHQTVQRCVERAVAYGALGALDDRRRSG